MFIFKIYISMLLMMMMMMMMMMKSTLATLMLFPQDISNISLFPSMDLADLAIKDGTPFVRSIFDVYILLLHVLMLVTEAYD